MSETFSTFHSWVLGNYPADESPIGELAGDLRSDPEFPTAAASWEEIEVYLSETGASESMVALAHRAWSQYRIERDEFLVAEQRDDQAVAVS